LSSTSDEGRLRVLRSFGVDSDECESILIKYIQENSTDYPFKLGANEDNLPLLNHSVKLNLALYLADKYLINFESTHCQPLLKEYLRLPWTESELMKTRNY
jgi:hypothetical protein